MAKSAFNSDGLPKAGRVNEVCREWLVHEDGALAYRLQDEEIKEHYTSNKIRNAQVREDLPRARVEQELEELRYQSLIQQQEEKDALVARQIALNLEREERMRERKLQEKMRLQLRLDDETTQLEAELENQTRIQQAKDQELARKLQKEEEAASVSIHEAPINIQVMQDQKLAMEAQDAELARMLQEKEKARARRARERARQRKLERQQVQQLENESKDERPERLHKLDLKIAHDKKSRNQHHHYHRHHHNLVDQLSQQYSDTKQIQALDESEEKIEELPNVATIIDPTYNGIGHQSSSDSSTATVTPSYTSPISSRELIVEDAPCYMPIQGQRRTQIQSPSLLQEEKHKRRVKDGCKTQ